MFIEEKSLFSFDDISTLINEYFFPSIFMYSPIFSKIEQVTFFLSLDRTQIKFNGGLIMATENKNLSQYDKNRPEDTLQAAKRNRRPRGVLVHRGGRRPRSGCSRVSASARRYP